MSTTPVFNSHPSLYDHGTIDLPSPALRRSMSISVLSMDTDEEKQRAQMHHNHQYRSNGQQVLHDLHTEFLKQEELRRQASEQLRQCCFWWLRLLSVVLMLMYGAFFLIGSTVTYADGYQYAAIIRIIHPGILASTLIIANLCVLAAFIGVLSLNQQRKKGSTTSTIYAFLLWASLALICVVGYFAYKHDLHSTNLMTSLQAQWHMLYTTKDHLALQRQLHCCGFDHPADMAVFHGHCRPDTLLPGCSRRMFLFEQGFLPKVRTAVLTLIPAHITVIIVTVLCSTRIADVFAAA